MRDKCDVNWISDDRGANAFVGRVVWDPVHSFWNGSMLFVALVLGPIFFTLSAFLVFIALYRSFRAAGPFGRLSPPSHSRQLPDNAAC